MESEETRRSESELQEPETEVGQQLPVQQNSNTPEDVEKVEEDASNSSQGEELVTTSTDCKEILKAMEVLERDSAAIAQSFTSLFASLRLGLSEVTGTSIDHMNCFTDASGRLQECALDAATKGNRYINSCLRLNEEMKGIENLACQLKILKRNVDALDSAVNRIVRLT